MNEEWPEAFARSDAELSEAERRRFYEFMLHWPSPPPQVEHPEAAGEQTQREAHDE
jgi:hypothetical protein